MASEHTHISCIQIEPAGAVAVVRFTREVVLSGDEAEAVGARLAALLDEPGQRRLVLDFGNVRSLSSLMLSELIKLQRKADSVAGRLALCNVRPVVRAIFEVTGLDRVISIFPGEPETLQSLR